MSPYNFPDAPATNDVITASNGVTYVCKAPAPAAKWDVQAAGSVGEAPADGQLYGRRGNVTPHWMPVVPLSGSVTMTGPLFLNADPVAAMGAATMQYVDAHAFVDAPTDGLVYGRNGKAPAAWQRAVAITGDVMTGELKITQGTSFFSVNKTTDGQLAVVRGQFNALDRWRMLLGNQVSETGADAGSDFALQACADNGGLKYPVMQASRATGEVTFPQAVHLTAPITAADQATTKAYVDAAGGGAKLTIADMAPVAANGAMWWSSVDCSLYIGYDDGTSTQWTAASPATGGGAGGGVPEAPKDGQVYGRQGTLGTWLATLPLTGGALTGALSLAADPVNPLEVPTKQYVDAAVAANVIPTWAAGADYAAGSNLYYDNLLFRVVTAITAAPAIPDFTTISPEGYGPSDYWAGPISATNWAANNWILLATVPAYGSFRIEIDGSAITSDMSMVLDISTSFVDAALSVVSAANNGGASTGMFGALRVSNVGGDNPFRLEAQISYAGGNPAAKIFVRGRATAVGGAVIGQTVIIPKPLVAQANTNNLGGTAYVQMQILGVTASMDAGWSGNVVIGADDAGYFLFSGGGMYKKGGAGLTLRESAGNAQPQIENNDGTNPRDILDCGPATQTKLGGISFGNATASGPQDLTRHIALYAPSFGFAITGGTLNYNVPNGNTHRFWSGSTQIMDLTDSDIIFQKSPVLYQNNTYRWRANTNASSTYVAYQTQDNAGRQLWALSAQQSGAIVGGFPEGNFIINTSNGGYGGQQLMTSQVASPPNALFNGDVYARGVILSSDLALKQDLEDIHPVELERAFNSLHPLIFRRKPAPRGEGATMDSPVGRREWGFIAQDIRTGAPDAVTESDGVLNFSVSDVLAIAVAKIKELEAKIAAFEVATPHV